MTRHVTLLYVCLLRALKLPAGSRWACFVFPPCPASALDFELGTSGFEVVRPFCVIVLSTVALVFHMVFLDLPLPCPTFWNLALSLLLIP